MSIRPLKAIFLRQKPERLTPYLRMGPKANKNDAVEATSRTPRVFNGRAGRT